MPDPTIDDALRSTPTPGFLRSLIGLAAVYFGCLSSFALLLAVVPLYLSERESAVQTTPGLSTGVLMFTSMAVGLLTPALGSRVGYRTFFLTALALMAATSAVWPFVFDGITLVLVSAVRGGAFAAVVVGVGSVASWALPATRRGEGLSVLGIVSTCAALTGLPLGVWMARNVGYTSVFVVAAAGPLVALMPAWSLATPARVRTTWWVTDRGSLWVTRRSALGIGTGALLSGVMVTHLPAYLGGAAPLVLLFHAGSLAAARWLTARWCDRAGSVPSLAITASMLPGAAGLTLTMARSPGLPLLIGAAVALGASFGVAQSLTIASMLAQLPAGRVGVANAVWNAAYDLGWAVGAVAVGVVIDRVNYAGGAVAAAAAALVAAAYLASACQKP
jgi:MFS family permease